MGVEGADAHRRRLRNLRRNIAEPVGKAVFVEAQALQVDAQTSITRGAVSGKAHVPSAPGEPPNQDTGVLAGNIEAVKTGATKAETSSNAPYAAAQEFGNEAANLAERPYMRPAANRAKERAPRNIAAAVNKVVRSSGAR